MAEPKTGPDDRMLEILIAPDRSLHHVEARGLLTIRREAYERRAIHIAMSAQPTTARQFAHRMSAAKTFEFGCPTEEIGGELRWRCDHRCGFLDGYCIACETNQIYQSEAHLAARRTHLAGVRKSHWRWLAGMWAQMLEY